LASSAEILSPGFTFIYRYEIMRLFDMKNSISAVVGGFGKSYVDFLKAVFPENNINCSTTMSLIKMSEMENLASTVKTLLDGTQLNESTLTVDNIQRFDRPGELIISGSRRNRYFDLGHVMEHLVSDSQYASFLVQMGKTVVWKDHTKRFMVGQGGFMIEQHSGLTTYIQQSVYPQINAAYESSSWYNAIY